MIARLVFSASMVGLVVAQVIPMQFEWESLGATGFMGVIALILALKVLPASEARTERVASKAMEAVGTLGSSITTLGKALESQLAQSTVIMGQLATSIDRLQQHCQTAVDRIERKE